jgi:prepilin-type processing-associated H-X9-DG protein
MTERTALFLASLSHQWSLMVLALSVLFGVATYGAGVLQTRARAGANTRTRRICTVLRVVSCALLTVSIAVLGVAFFHVGCAALKAHSAQCMSNVKQLARIVWMYSQDFDERLPPSTQWAEAIDSRVKEAASSNADAGGDPFRCLAAESPASYGMNAALGGISMSMIDAPANTVLLFDAEAPIRSFAGGARDVARRRHNGAPNVALADGHARGANVFVLEKLKWVPTDANGQRQTVP